MRVFVGLTIASAVALAGCSSTSVDTITPTSARVPTVAAAPAAYPVDNLVGSWGVASFREEKDRARTEAQARSFCSRPYVIAKGPSDGVMMHVADDPKQYELTLKGAAGGKTYLGFEGPPGDDQDREIISMADNMFVTRYINPETHTRYGTFVYVRCGAARAARR